jgi:thiamine biosynthesis protein ThiS
MKITLNGEPRDFPDGLTLAALIAQLGMKADRVAVELNLEIAPRSSWETTLLKDGDKLEIVHFVGGGSAQTEINGSRTILSTAEWVCPACGMEAARSFCSRCGEKKSSTSDLSVRYLLEHAAGELFHYDSKMFRSFRLLFSQPGFLTAEYLRGCRKPYLHPFQLFFVANLIYFLVQPLTGWSGLKGWLNVQTHMMFYSGFAARLAAHRMAAKHLTELQLNQAFDHIVDIQARSLVIVIVPLFALAVWLLQCRKRRYFGEHLVFALHFTAFWLMAVYMGIYGGSSLIVRLFAHFGIKLHFSQVLVLAPLS